MNWSFSWRISPEVRKVLLLMLPVTLSLGLINFNLVINSFFGTFVSDQAPAAIDKAFRIYMLPQGIFSVAITTVVFPSLARFAAREEFDNLRATMANGMRQIMLLLIPAAAAILVLAEPMTQLVYQRGEFDAQQTDVVAEALFWFAFSLPFNGLFLLMTRTFFSLQRPWVPTWIAGINLAVTAAAAGALYGPFGVGGIVAATAIATIASVVAQVVILRRDLGGIEGGAVPRRHDPDHDRRRRAAAAVLRDLERPRHRARREHDRPDRLPGRRPCRRRRHLLLRGHPASGAGGRAALAPDPSDIDTSPVAEDMEKAVVMLRDAYDAFNGGDFDAVLEKLHPDIEWHRVAEVEGIVHGRDAVGEFLRPDIFEQQKASIVGITTHGDRLLVHAKFRGSFAGSGIELEQDGWQLWTIRDGLAAKLEVFLDRDKAVAAAGPEG